MDETRNRVRKSLRDSFPVLFGDQWEDAAKVFYARFDDIHISQISPIEGADQMLKDLSDLGIYLAVVSNKRGEYLRKEVLHLGWDKYFSKLVGALDAKKDKPATDPVELALADCHHKSGSTIWFVGDADIDMECAINAGLTPVLLRLEPPKPEEFKQHPPICHIVDCAALSKLIHSM